MPQTRIESLDHGRVGALLRSKLIGSAFRPKERIIDIRGDDKARFGQFLRRDDLRYSSHIFAI